MKKLIIICLVVLLMESFCGTSVALSIRDREEYVASSSLILGALDAVKGYAITADFQLNLEYQAGIANAAIEALNDYGLPDLKNYADNEYYYLKVNTSGGLPIGIWDFENSIQYFAPDSGQSWVEWTLSYWSGSFYHTILAGNIIDDPVLHVIPTAGYRTFLWDGLANDVEVFGGTTIDCEVLGYSFTNPIGEGSILTPILVPEPATIAVLSLGGLLLRRKK